MKKPRILIIIDRFYPIVAGSERQAYQLAKFLDKNNYKTTVLTRQITKNFKKNEKINNIIILRLPSYGNNKFSQYLPASYLHSHGS